MNFFLGNILNRKRISALLSNVVFLVYDFDGVLTDNCVYLCENGLEIVRLNRSDGLAISRLKEFGFKQMILSTEQKGVVQLRAKKLQIPVIFGTKDKKVTLVEYCKDAGISMNRVAYIGNDINDLEIMKIVGLPLCPSDAYSEIKKISMQILKTPGGKGVVRELMNIIIANREDLNIDIA